MTNTTTDDTTALITAAGNVVTAHVDAITQVAKLATATAANPPKLTDALIAVLHLNISQPHIDNATTEMFRSLIDAGVTEAKLARLLGIRSSVLSKRLNAGPVTMATPAPDLEPGWFTIRDRTSMQAARESLIPAGANLATTYGAALRPLSVVRQGNIAEAATLDATLAAVLHLHAARQNLAASLDPILACLVLGSVKRMALSGLLGWNPATLQRHLQHQALANARGCDLVKRGGVWVVEPAETGRYAPTNTAETLEKGVSAT